MSFLPLFILEGREPRRCQDPVAWDRWMATANRYVALDEVGEIKISTIFLGMDHGHGIEPLVLFETKVFGGYYHGMQCRHTSWGAAEDGHRHIVEFVRQSAEDWPAEIGSGESWQGIGCQPK